MDSLPPEVTTELRWRAVQRAAEQEDWPAVVIEAEELLDLDPRHPHALIYLANAALELGDALNAAAAFALHVEVAGPDVDALSGLAMARFESCDIQGAVEAARASLSLDPGLAEAHYTLGLALERTRGQSTKAASSFAAARMLDPEAYPWPVELTDEMLQDVLLQAVHALPTPVAQFWSGVPMRVEEQPTMSELVRGPAPIPPTVAGMYSGMPPLEEDLSARPKSLRLFRRNLSRCGSLERIVDQLTDVMVQEALDWMGVPLERVD